MNAKAKERLIADGWVEGDAQSFLGLSDAEMQLIKMRTALAKELRAQRRKRKISQARLAQQVGSSQSRVAKMEAGDPTVSLDLLVKTLMVTGSTGRRIGKVIAAVG